MSQTPANPITPLGVRWTLIALGMAILPHLAKVPFWLSIALIVLVFWRWRESRQHPYKPPWMLIRVIITLAGIAGVYLAHGGLLGRRAATTLLMVMLVLKLLELSRPRDGRLVVSTGFFLTATHFLFNQDLIYLPWMLLCAVTGVAALRQLHDDSLNLVNTKSIGLLEHGPQLVRIAGRILFLAIPLSLALFILFPRLATPLWGIPEYALDGKSGLSDSMRPGRIQQMFLDDSPAFRATFEGQAPISSELYWRGPVLWNFDGETWTQGYVQRADRDQIPAPSAAKYRYEIQLEPHEQHWLFALDYPTQWPDDSFLTYEHQLVSRQPITSLTRYDIATAPGFKDQPDHLPFHSKHRSLQIPRDSNPRTQELMQRWRQETPNNGALVQRAMNYFREQPFFYSLEAPPLGQHGVDEFLFDLRIGYCEYYASAFVVMMRAAGIPARVVTGYLGGTYNSVGNYLLVRQSDAHAWAEVWLPGEGWTRMDPTAMVSPERVEQGASAALNYDYGWQSWQWVRHFSTSLDAVRNLWNQWVLSFDARRQERLLNPFGIDELKHQHLVLLLVVVLSAIGFVLHLYLQRQRLRRKDPAQELYQRALRRLARVGLRKASTEGAEEFALRIQSVLSQGGSDWLLLTQDYYRARYANQADALESLRQRCQSFRPVRLKDTAPPNSAAA